VSVEWKDTVTLTRRYGGFDLSLSEDVVSDHRRDNVFLGTLQQ